MREALLVECRARTIEPQGRIDRIVTAAQTRAEKTFCARTIERLGACGPHDLRVRLPGQPGPAPGDPRRAPGRGELELGEHRVHYGKDGALTGPDKEHAETSMLALHLLQSSLVHINTLLLQRVLAEPVWAKKLSDEDRRGLTALFWSNINPYGTFQLDMDKRLELTPPTSARTI